jgi:dTDP-glucose 4,6-dehydratase
VKKVLLTGGAGFMGHHFAEHLLRHTDYDLIFLDRLDTSGNLNRITQTSEWEKGKTRCKWIWHDLRAPINSQLMAQIGRVDMVVHLAAATHVDRSITDPLSFVYDNVVGTANLLEYARATQPDRFFYFSTDEVFGPAPEGTAYKEWDRYKSANPYAATKAGAEELCIAYQNTYKMPIIITHCMNIFGERQHPEKFIPNTIAKVRDGKRVQIHANADRTKSGSRFYIHARNVADALLHLIPRGIPGEKYNIVGEREVDNLAMAQFIAQVQGKTLDFEMLDFHSQRPGHDLRYALDGSRMAEMGWAPPISFETSLERTINWTLAHPEWLLE